MKNITYIIMLMSMIFLFIGCGNKWELTKKNWKTDYRDVSRHVVVYDSFTKNILWDYIGPVYVSDSSTPGNLSLIYWDDNTGDVHKNDFIGNHIQMYMIEIVKSEK